MTRPNARPQPSRQRVSRPDKIIPKQSLGQNWLLDETHLAHIVAAADLTAVDTVIEVGPGLGLLTRKLAEQAGRVIAVELDNRLIEPLNLLFATQTHVQIVHGDILELDPVALVAADPSDKAAVGTRNAERPYKVVANLPYYITSAALRHFLEAQPPPSLAVVMVQKEVAERICAEPGDMSLLAISVQFYAEPSIVHRVPAGAFRPPPKVDSAVLRLAVRATPAVPDVPSDAFFRVVRAGFSQKRKQLLNTLSTGLHLPKTTVRELLTNAAIEPTRRAETLTLDEWGALCRGWLQRRV